MFFSEMRGITGLGKRPDRDYTEQIASISIAITQYNLLGFVKRLENGTS